MKNHDIKFDEIYIVLSIIDKLHPSWRDVRHALKHQKEDISLFDLGQHIVVESSIRAHEGHKDSNPNVGTIYQHGWGETLSRRKVKESFQGEFKHYQSYWKWVLGVW